MVLYPIPPMYFSNERGNAQLDPQFYEYLRMDQCVGSWIYATFSREVLINVHKLISSAMFGLFLK